MTRFFAQPYDLHANGFYFDDSEEFQDKVSKVKNDFGDLVEEFEIQFIDGDDIEAQLFKVLSVGQWNIAAFIEVNDSWSDEDKIKLICAVGDCGYDFEIGKDNPEQFDIDIYVGVTMRELAEQFIDEGLFGEIPESIQSYIDYDAVARDLSMDYSEMNIAGKCYIHRCG